MGRHRLDPANPAYWSAVILARHRAHQPGHATSEDDEDTSVLGQGTPQDPLSAAQAAPPPRDGNTGEDGDTSHLTT